jgi:hypothetical protein
VLNERYSLSDKESHRQCHKLLAIILRHMEKRIGVGVADDLTDLKKVAGTPPTAPTAPALE